MLSAKSATSERPDRAEGATPDWQPDWIVNLGHGDTVGITIDNGCFVVLYPHDGNWRPGTHIPRAAAERIALLLLNGIARLD
jgi:hypothetical protein